VGQCCLSLKRSGLGRCAKRVTRDAEDGVTARAAGRARSQVCVVLEEVTWQAGVNSSRQSETSHPSAAEAVHLLAWIAFAGSELATCASFRISWG
jgi:citrate lyase beta subunit